MKRQNFLFLNITRIAGSPMGSTELRHANVVCEVGGNSFQAYCACGWTSTISYFEEVDLLRAMHAHAVTTFGAYR
jgi:hypothetical protein